MLWDGCGAGERSRKHLSVEKRSDPSREPGAGDSQDGGGDEGATRSPCRVSTGLEREGKQVRAPWELICGGHGEPCPRQRSQDEVVALTPWKEPWRTLLLPN